VTLTVPLPVLARSLPPPSEAALDAAISLRELLGGRVSTSDPDRVAYARDMWPKALLWIRQGRLPPPPDLIAWPKDEAEVQKVIAFARERRLPVVPFGAGSGVCGGTWAVRGGIALDLKKLEKVGTVDADALTVESQAGVIGEVLERNLNAQGYTLGHFPSSIYMSTLGGWLAARSAGQLSNRYGKIEDMTLSVRAVTGAGELVSTPERPFRGPELAQALIGSEGTLCAFTSAKLRVHPYPEHRAFRGFKFRDVEAGVEAIRRLYRAGLRPAVVRLYDPFDTAIHKSDHGELRTPPSLRSGFKADVVPALLRGVSRRTLGRPAIFNRATRLLRNSLLVLMFEGELRRATREEEAARAICKEAGGSDQGEAPGKSWFARRYDVSFKMSPVIDDGGFADTMEVACTWDQVMDVYARVRAAVTPLAFVLCHFSHAYLEGCSLYFSFVGSGRDEGDQEARYEALWQAALSAAMSAGATVSHHHGVGMLKARALLEELGDGRRLLFALKRTFDPDGIMNPGKLGL
jgi:alkyldihydroxyacetonephosphate synthase